MPPCNPVEDLKKGYTYSELHGTEGKTLCDFFTLVITLGDFFYFKCSFENSGCVVHEQGFSFSMRNMVVAFCFFNTEKSG